MINKILQSAQDVMDLLESKGLQPEEKYAVHSCVSTLIQMEISEMHRQRVMQEQEQGQLSQLFGGRGGVC